MGPLVGGSMPAIEMVPSAAGRVRVFLRAQLPLLLGTGYVVVAAAVAVPAALTDTWLPFGVALVVGASLASLGLPWERWNVHWLLIVAVVDVFGVAAVRAALLDTIPAVGLLSVFPVIWMVYGFRRETMILAVASVLFIALFPFFDRGVPPRSWVDWANALTLPILMTGIVIVVRAVARQVQATRRQIERTADQLSVSLREAEDAGRVLRSVLETVDMGVAYYDHEGKLTIANQHAYEAAQRAGFRLDQAPYSGPHVLESDRKTSIPSEEQIIPRALRGELVSNHLEWVGEEGDQYAILATAQRVRRPNGELLGTVIAAYDVTQLAEAVRVRDDFLLTVSHELRTPLTSILGYLELVDDELSADEEQVRSMLAVIDRNARNLLQRITELLSFSPGGIDLHPVDTDLAQLARHAEQALRIRADNAGVALTVVAPTSARAPLDPRRTTQIVENLLTNAVKYTPRGGSATLTVSIDDSHAVIEVADTGVGMSPEEQRHAFDRFYRAQAARQGAIQGLGVGLALVHEIVDAYRGEITLASEKGDGTTVTVRLPLPAAQADESSSNG